MYNKKNKIKIIINYKFYSHYYYCLKSIFLKLIARKKKIILNIDLQINNYNFYLSKFS